MNTKTVFTVFALLSTSVISMASDLGIANHFNAFVLGNATLNGNESDGSVAIGGNVSGSGFGFRGHSTDTVSVGTYTNVGMLIGGSVSFTGNAQTETNITGLVNGSFSSPNGFDTHGGHVFAGGTVTVNNNNNYGFPGVQQIAGPVWNTTPYFSTSASDNSAWD